MRKIEVESFDKLPFLNPKFNAFFQGKKGIGLDLKDLFDANKIKNERNDEQPHNVYFGEDITQIYSNDGLVNFVCQFDNHGVGKVLLGSFVHNGMQSSAHYEFSITDNPAESSYSVCFTKYEQDFDLVKSSAGVEIFSPKGLQSSLENTIVSSTQTGEMLEARSAFSYVDSEDKLCSEILAFESPNVLNTQTSDLLGFRNELLENDATAVYMVDNKKAPLPKIDEIIKTSEQAITTEAITEFLPQ